jgi:hypothetical protein
MMTHSLTKKQIAELRRNRLHRKWLDWYERLVMFKDRFGRWPRSSDQYPKGIKLGIWVRLQRSNYTRGTMVIWRRRLLDEIEFPYDMNEYYWRCAFQSYKEWRRKHGRIPSVNSKSPLERKNARWQHGQRISAKKGLLNEMQLAKLKDNGVLEYYKDVQREKKLNALKEFIQKKNRLPALGNRVSGKKKERELAWFADCFYEPSLEHQFMFAFFFFHIFINGQGWPIFLSVY